MQIKGIQMQIRRKVEKTLLKIFKPRLFRIVLLALVLPIILFFIYHFYYATRIIPGVRIGNVYVGGMDQDSAKKALEQSYIASEQVIVLKNNEYRRSIFAEDVNLEYKWDVSIARAFEFGRKGDFYIDTKDKLVGLVRPLHVPAYNVFDETLLTQALFEVYNDVSEPAQDATYALDKTSIRIVPSQRGRELNVDNLYGLVVDSFSDIDFGEKFLPTEIDEPEFSERDLKHLQSRVENIVFTPLSIVYEEKSWYLDPAQKLNLITVSRANGDLDLTLDFQNLKIYIKSLEAEINKPPRGSVGEVDGEKVLKFEITTVGKELDVNKFTNDFKSAFFMSSPEVKVVTKETNSLEDPSKYGITALLGEGHSRYTGSAMGRIHNLTLAAERTSGVLIPPGGIYSFNASVGEISAATGYDTAYIISNGKTILGEGGGVCQTSTTLFRAVLDSGLPIVTRHPHAYRVGYYEIDSAVGFDASIYQPSLDLQFKNDTEYYALVQASWDLNARSLTFKIFGTPDGREVMTSEPVVTNLTPPPEPLYQDDPTLPRGTVKQVDFAAWGADVSFKRVVTRDDEVLYEDTFSSSYRPWQAVFLVGTKD